MQRCSRSFVAALVLGGLSESLPLVAQMPVGTAFSYQGRLRQGGSPFTGTADFSFTLWDAPSGGSQYFVGDEATAVPVNNGLFNVTIDFGIDPFDGTARWLEVTARVPAGMGSFVTLSPRHEITSTPYSLFSQQAPWNGLVDLPAGFADGVDDGGQYFAGDGLELAGATFSIADGAVTSTHLASDAASLAKVTGSVMTAASGNVGVGTAAPTAKLEVNGDLKVSGAIRDRVGSTALASNTAYAQTEVVLLTMSINTHGGTVIAIGKLRGIAGPFSDANIVRLYRDNQLVDTWKLWLMDNEPQDESAVVTSTEGLPAGMHTFELRALSSSGQRTAQAGDTKLTVMEF